MKTILFIYLMNIFNLCFAGEPNSILINGGPSIDENYDLFDNELLYLSRLFNKTGQTVLNGQGYGSQFITPKENSLGNPIYRRSSFNYKDIKQASFDNVSKTISNQLKQSNPLFIYVNGHGTEGNTPLWNGLDYDDRRKLDYSELFKAIQNRPDKSKKVKLAINNCYSGSFFSKFTQTSDFESNFCAVTAATGVQFSAGEPINKFKNSPSLSNILSPEFLNADANISNQLSTSTYFALLALKEFKTESLSSCQKRKDKLIQDFDSPFGSIQLDFLLEESSKNQDAMLEISRTSRLCKREIYLRDFKLKKQLFDKIESLDKKLPEYTYKIKEFKKYLDKDIHASKYFTSKTIKEDLLKCVLNTNPKLVIPLLKEDKSLASENTNKLQTVILKLTDFDEKTKIVSSKIKILQPPNLNQIISSLADDSKLDDDTTYIENSNFEKIKKYLQNLDLEQVEYFYYKQNQKSVVDINTLLAQKIKEFENFLNTPEGIPYRKKYFALKKCESEPINNF